MRVIAIGLLILVGSILIYGAGDLPPRGVVDAPVHTQVADTYVERAAGETHAPNVVTAILADYRSYDTLGEATVVFVAGLAVVLILQGARANE